MTCCHTTSASNRSLDALVNFKSYVCCKMYMDLLSIVFIIVVTDPSRDLKEYSQQFCSGTLIRQDLVLTAASCFNIDEYVGEPYPSVTSVYERPGTMLTAYRIFVHPLYLSDKKFNFAIIIVEKSKQNNFPEIHTNMENIDRILSDCTLGGFGSQYGPPRLKTFRSIKMNTSVTTVFETRKVDHEWRRFFIVLHELVPCLGDMGSPLLCNGELYAIYTPRSPYPRETKRCLDRYAALFTPVYPAMEWINQVRSIPSTNIVWMFNGWYLLLLLVVVVVFMIGIYCCVIEVLKRKVYPPDYEDADAKFESAKDDIYSCLSNAMKQAKDQETIKRDGV